LHDITMAKETKEAIGKAWPLFFLLIFNMKKDNRYTTTYAELEEKLSTSHNTIKDWRNHLVQHQVVKAIKGDSCLSFVLLSPYDSLVTCEQDDWAAVRIKTDVKVKRVLDKLSSHDNMSLLPVLVELAAKVDKLEKKYGDV
jgi:hypothetical protein